MAVWYSVIKMDHYLPVITCKLCPEFLGQDLILINDHATYTPELKCIYQLTVPLSEAHFVIRLSVKTHIPSCGEVCAKHCDL